MGKKAHFLDLKLEKCKKEGSKLDSDRGTKFETRGINNE